jgi:hypothetical protein
MTNIQQNLGSDKNKNKSVPFTKYMMENEEAPFYFIMIIKNENENKLPINDILDLIQKKLVEFSANIKFINLNKREH